MATRIKPTTAQLYETDFYAWAKAQADLLRAGRYADLDLEHLIEEVDDLGESLRRSVRSRIRTIIEHLLKLEHSPAREPRGGWYDTVLAQRSDLLDELTASIRREVELLPDLYDRARQNAATSLRKHGEHAAAGALPATCPYTLDQITSDWLPRRPRWRKSRDGEANRQLTLQPLTAPAVRPETMARWKISTSTISGTVTITDAAMMLPQGSS